MSRYARVPFGCAWQAVRYFFGAREATIFSKRGSIFSEPRSSEGPRAFRGTITYRLV